VATKDAVTATKEAVASTKAALVEKINPAAGPICPIRGRGPCGEEGDCPFSLAKLNKTPPPAVPARPADLAPGELSKVEKVLLKGSELFQKENYAYAEVSYDKAIELDPQDWRGHFGKVAALQGAGKPFKAFQACRRGCEALPDCPLMRELEDSSREEYKRSKEEAKGPPPPPPQKFGAEECPGNIDAPMPEIVSRSFNGRLPSKEERFERKDQILNIFREQWARIGKTKETMGYNDYSKEQASGLQITGGHRPMPRPDGVVMPKDWRQPIGVVSSEHMIENFNCNCERLLLSIHGDIFDVSDRPDKYGKGAPYYYFAGCDITWGLVTGNDSEHAVNMFFDLFKMDNAEISKKMQCICSWTGFYEVEYGKPVGRLAEFEDEVKLPAPPVHNQEECVVQ
jgi:hypothetical protein